MGRNSDACMGPRSDRISKLCNLLVLQDLTQLLCRRRNPICGYEGCNVNPLGHDAANMLWGISLKILEQGATSAGSKLDRAIQGLCPGVVIYRTLHTMWTAQSKIKDEAGTKRQRAPSVGNCGHGLTLNAIQCQEKIQRSSSVLHTPRPPFVTAKDSRRTSFSQSSHIKNGIQACFLFRY